MRKPVFWVFYQLSLKPACSADETSQGLEILVASRGITVNFLNIQTPKRFVVITLKVEQDGVSLE